MAISIAQQPNYSLPLSFLSGMNVSPSDLASAATAAGSAAIGSSTAAADITSSKEISATNKFILGFVDSMFKGFQGIMDSVMNAMTLGRASGGQGQTAVPLANGSEAGVVGAESGWGISDLFDGFSLSNIWDGAIVLWKGIDTKGRGIGETLWDLGTSLFGKLSGGAGTVVKLVKDLF